jgi:hypothetical protein
MSLRNLSTSPSQVRCRVEEAPAPIYVVGLEGTPSSGPVAQETLSFSVPVQVSGPSQVVALKCASSAGNITVPIAQFIYMTALPVGNPPS